MVSSLVSMLSMCQICNLAAVMQADVNRPPGVKLEQDSIHEPNTRNGLRRSCACCAAGAKGGILQAVLGKTLLEHAVSKHACHMVQDRQVHIWHNFGLDCDRNFDHVWDVVLP